MNLRHLFKLDINNWSWNEERSKLNVKSASELTTSTLRSSPEHKLRRRRGGRTNQKCVKFLFLHFWCLKSNEMSIQIKWPYFHVNELDEPQLVNWRKYLDFKEVERDFARIQFLYEWCLVTYVFYDEFWFWYTWWMSAQDGKEEEVRNIYQRAACLFMPIR